MVQGMVAAFSRYKISIIYANSSAYCAAQYLRLQTRTVPLRKSGWSCESAYLPWKINPFWMAKFVSHEVQIAFASKTHGDGADHLVKRNSSLNRYRWTLQNRHATIHLSSHQAEGCNRIWIACRKDSFCSRHVRVNNTRPNKSNTVWMKIQAVPTVWSPTRAWSCDSA